MAESDIWDDFIRQVNGYRKAIGEIHFVIDELIDSYHESEEGRDIEYISKIGRVLESEKGYLRKAEDLYNDSNLMVEYAKSSTNIGKPTSDLPPPSEPIKDCQRNHEEALMRYIAVIESMTTDSRIEDPEYETLKSMLEDNNVDIEKSPELSGFRKTYRQIIPRGMMEKEHRPKPD